MILQYGDLSYENAYSYLYIRALLTQNESNPSELAHAYEEFIETMTEMVANFDNRDDILRILYYSRVEFDVLSHPSFNRYSNNVLRTTFIYKNHVYSGLRNQYRQQ